jgi:hypothetical protein
MNNDTAIVIHGSELGRSHRSIRRHLAEDHGFSPQDLEPLGDGAIHGIHDRDHHTTWAYAFDLAHPFFPGRKLPETKSRRPVGPIT